MVVNDAVPAKAERQQPEPVAPAKTIIYWSVTEHRWKPVPASNQRTMRAARSAASEVQLVLRRKSSFGGGANYAPVGNEFVVLNDVLEMIGRKDQQTAFAPADLDWHDKDFAAQAKPRDVKFPKAKAGQLRVRAIEQIDERAGADQVFAFALAARETKGNLRDVGRERVDAGIDPDALLIGAGERGAAAQVVVPAAQPGLGIDGALGGKAPGGA